MFLTTWPQHWHLISAVLLVSASSQALEMRHPPLEGAAPASAQQEVMAGLSWLQLEDVFCFPTFNTLLTDNLLKGVIQNIAPAL